MKKILSIDGGGIRGLIPALVLAEIEAQSGKAIGATFDLIAGTSTGGLLALGFAKNDGNGKAQYSANNLADIYLSRGNEIFSKSFLKSVASVEGLRDELYSANGIEHVLDDYFGDDPLSSCITKSLVTCYDIQNREPLFLKSWREEYQSVLMKHAARATSAAPTYFEPALIPIGGATKALVDGAVYINTPSVSAYAEALKLFEDEQDFFVLSLGTGELIRPISYDKSKNWGKAEWVVPLLSCMFDGMADAANYQMKMLLDDKYVRLQTNLSVASDDLDNVTANNLENLILESQKLIRTHRQVIDMVCSLL
uniref:Patatin family protein n=1 Tax=Chlorobium chlorochromatii (strain CaD3) TaxID=340177 RepID=Q3ANS2_CHLCH